MKSNCLLWALCAWWRNHGVGYLLIRKSRLGPFPHFLYLRVLPPNADVGQFVPVRPKRRWIPPPWFEGRIKRCDREECIHCPKSCK